MNCIQILESLAVIIASGVAILGINSWRREMRGRKKYELAEDVLALFYEAKDKIIAIRSALGMKDESEGREIDPKEDPDLKEALDQAFVVFNRYQKHQETFNRLRALRYRFMTLFGKEKVKPFDDLNKILEKIFSAANILGHYWYRIRKKHLIRSQKEFDKLVANIEKYEAIFWEGMADPDPITPEVDRIILEVEEICEPILKQRQGFYSKILRKKN